MLLDITLKLTTPFLGSSKPTPENNNVRRIRRNINGKPVFYSKQFVSVMANYASTMGVSHFDKSAIEFIPFLDINEEKFPASIFVRKFYDKELKKFKKDEFESFAEGTLVGVKCLLHEDLLALNTFTNVLELTGTLYGISPFGAKWNYGHFEIETITQDQSHLSSIGIEANLSEQAVNEDRETRTIDSNNADK